MIYEVKRDLDLAKVAVANKVIPLLMQHKEFKCCTFKCLEEYNGANDLAKLLDISAGIDYLIITPNGLLGMAVRCQQAYYNSDNLQVKYHTFTVRQTRDNHLETEMAKRKDAYDHDCYLPTWTVQAYLKDSWDSDLDYLGIIKTKDMYANYDKIKIGERKANGVVFDVIGWKECLINGLRMGIYPATLREELK